MAKKSQLTVDFMHPLVRLIEKYRLKEKLEKDSHIPTSRIKHVLEGDIHDHLCRVIIALSRYVSREDMEKAFSQSMSLVYGLSSKEYKKHSCCYTNTEWKNSPYAKDKVYPTSNKKSEKEYVPESNKNHD